MTRYFKLYLFILELKYPQWQAAYDKLDKYVFANEPTCLTYYFGVPIENKDHHSAANQMLAFEIYGTREVRYCQRELAS